MTFLKTKNPTTNLFKDSAVGFKKKKKITERMCLQNINLNCKI